MDILLIVPCYLCKRYIILRAVNKIRCNDEKNIPTVTKKKKKQTRFQIQNGNRKWPSCIS